MTLPLPADLLQPATADMLPRAQRPLFAGFTLLVITGLASIWLVIAGHQETALVTHTLAVKAGAERVLTLTQDAETGQRGFLLTGDDTYLAPYREGQRNVLPALADVARLTRDNPRQQAELASLRGLVTGKLAELARTIAARRASGDPAAAIAIVRTGRGQALMDQIRTSIARIETEEETLLRFREADADRFNVVLLAVSLGGLVIALALGLASFSATRRYTRQLVEKQSELAAINENLETIVARRTADLVQSNDEIQRYAYIVSHDLRAPLVNIMGFTSELDATRETIAAELHDNPRAAAILADYDEAISFIKAAVTKMERLIGAILTISREGRRTFRPEPLDMTRLITDQADAQRHQAATSGLEVTVDPLPGVVADRLAVEQIFGNLIDNAIKYQVPDRPGRIRISGEAIGSRVRYRVRDNGRGIAQADFTRIFELFRRAGPQDRPGDGIGLAHVNTLVRNMGGNIEVSSELGEGTTFMVTLPRTPPPPARLAPRREAA
jgi:signal transduction histidine kinase